MLALVYAWTGERDTALTQLEKIVRLPRGPDYGELRFGQWDEIRTDPRFDRLLSQAALSLSFFHSTFIQRPNRLA